MAGPRTRIVVTGIDLTRRSARGSKRRGRSRCSTTSSWTRRRRSSARALAADGYLQPVVNVAHRRGGDRRRRCRSRSSRGSQTSQTMRPRRRRGRSAGRCDRRRGSRSSGLDRAGGVKPGRRRARGGRLPAQPGIPAGAGHRRRAAVRGRDRDRSGDRRRRARRSRLRASRSTARRALPRTRACEAVALTDGAPYDTVAVDAARDRLVARYRREAFPAATVTVQPDIPAKATAVNVTFVVDEGPQQVLGEAVVAGNRAIDADVIVRALGLDRRAADAGGPAAGPHACLRHGAVPARGRVVRADARAGGQRRCRRRVPIRLRIAVEEWPALRLRYGFQVAEERPEDSREGRDLTPGLSADLTRRTLFGRAITLGGAVEWQRRERVGARVSQHGHAVRLADRLVADRRARRGCDSAAARS